MKKCTCLYKAGCGRTLGSPCVGGPRSGLESQMLVSLSPPTTLPTQSPRNQQRLPLSECTHTPVFPGEIAS